MAEWKAALPQIIASIIGSGLVVTLFGALVAEINSPNIEITLRFVSFENKTENKITNFTNFTNIFTNVGGSAANNVRLTMFYPGANIINPTVFYANENTKLESEREDSLRYFLPRLASGGSAVIHLTIDKRVDNQDRFVPPSKYSTKGGSHVEPYTITAAYDEGSNTYIPYDISLIIYTRYNPQILVIPLGLTLIFLSFVVAFRFKRKSGAKFASEILKNVLTVIFGLKKEPEMTLSYSNWDKTDIENKRRIFNDYEDYKNIDDFFNELKNRERFILSSQEVIPTLNEVNEKCIEQATKAYTGIRWKKFFKLEYLLGIPLIILGSFFITLVCTGIPFVYNINTPQETVKFSFIYFSVNVPFSIASTIARSIAGFFITILVLRITNNVNIYDNMLPKLSLFYTFLLSIAIVGVPSYYITEPILDLFNFISGNQLENYVSDFLSLSAINYLSDIFRLLLLIVLALRCYKKRIDKLELGEKIYR